MLELSLDGVVYQEVMTIDMEDRREHGCTPPLETYSINRMGQYIRVSLIAYYGHGSGLHYFKVLHLNKKL